MIPGSSDDETLADGSWPQSQPAQQQEAGEDDLRLVKRLAIDDRGVESWLAVQQDLQRQVLVRLQPEAVHSEDPQLLQEALVCAWLDHPGIMTIHDADHRRVVQRQVELRSLADHWAGIHSIADICEVLIRACQTLAHVHSRGLVHAAFDASCLAVGGFGEVLITGWNQAKITPWATSLAAEQQRPPPPALEQVTDANADLLALNQLFARLPLGDTSAPSAALVQELIDDLQAAPPRIGLAEVIQRLQAVQGQVAAEERAEELLQSAHRCLFSAPSAISVGRLAVAQEGLRAVDAALALRPNWEPALAARRSLLAETIRTAMSLDDFNLAASLAADPQAGAEERQALRRAQRAQEQRQRLRRVLRALSIAATVLIIGSLIFVQVLRRYELAESLRRRQEQAKRLIAEAEDLSQKEDLSASKLRQAVVRAVQAVGLDDRPEHRQRVLDLAEHSIAFGIQDEAIDSAWRYLDLARRFGLDPQRAEALIGDPEQEGSIRYVEDAEQRQRRQALALRQGQFEQLLALEGQFIRPDLSRRITQLIASWDIPRNDPQMAELTLSQLRRLLASEGNLRSASVDGLALLNRRQLQRGLAAPLNQDELLALWPEASFFERTRLLACLLDLDDGSLLTWLGKELNSLPLLVQMPGPGRVAFLNWLRRFAPAEEERLADQQESERKQGLQGLANLYRLAHDDESLQRISSLGYDGSEIDAQIQRFRQAYFNSNIAAALSAIQRLDAMEGVDARSMIPALAELLRRRGNIRLAEEIIDHVMARPPPPLDNRLPVDAASGSLSVEALIVYTAVGRMEEAAVLIDDVLRRFHVLNHSRSAGDLISALYAHGRDADAMRILSKTLAGLKQDSDMWAYYNLARSMHRQGAHAIALSICDQAIARWPEFHYAYALRGRMYALLGQQDMAEADAQMALSILPRRPGILAAHAQVLILRGAYDQALSRILMGRRLVPDYRGDLMMGINAARQAGHYGSALELAQAESRQDRLHALWLLRCLLEAGAADLAVEQLITWAAEFAEEEDPGSAQFLRLMLDMLLLQDAELRSVGWHGLHASDQAPWLWWEASATAMSLRMEDDARLQRSLDLLEQAEALDYRPEVARAMAAFIKAAAEHRPASQLLPLAQQIFTQPLAEARHPIETILRHNVISAWIDEMSSPSGRPLWPIPMSSSNHFIPLACEDLALSPNAQENLRSLLARKRPLFGFSAESEEHENEVHRLLAERSLPAPQQQFPDLRSAIRQLSRGRADWDFPPQSHRQRREQQRAEGETKEAEE